VLSCTTAGKISARSARIGIKKKKDLNSRPLRWRLPPQRWRWCAGIAAICAVCAPSPALRSMSGWGGFDEGDEWGEPVVVKKKATKKKPPKETPPEHEDEWDDTPLSSSPTAAKAAPQRQTSQRPEAAADAVAAGEPLDLDALQQQVSELDAHLEMEEQERLICDALRSASDPATIFDLKEMHGNVRAIDLFLSWLSACCALLFPPDNRRRKGAR
jgi:hypothetical protein